MPLGVAYGSEPGAGATDRAESLVTRQEILNSDLVKTHGVEMALLILANSQQQCARLLEIRKERIEYLEKELRKSV